MILIEPMGFNYQTFPESAECQQSSCRGQLHGSIYHIEYLLVLSLRDLDTSQSGLSDTQYMQQVMMMRDR
jgi:hypothetical protein